MSTLKLPRYLKWRNGRPRWEPGPRLREAGWKGRSLKDANGNWLSLEAAIAAADEINRQVDEWRKAGAQPLRPARRRQVARHERTLAALWDVYETSERFRNLRASTQKDYRNRIRIALAWAGDKPVAALDEPVIDAFYARLRRSRGEHQAAGVMAVLRLLLSHAVRLRWIDHNPAKAMRISRPRPAPEGRIWTRAEVAAIVQTADEMGEHGLADAFLIALHTGQRAGDVRRIEAFHEVNGRLRLRLCQSKTQAVVDIPASAELARRLRQIAERHRRAGREHPPALVIDDRTGRPFTRHGLSHRFAEVRAEACRRHPKLAKSMANKTFAAARHTCVTWLAEAGCEIPQIAAITGHSIASVTQIIEHYLARTSHLADAAIAALERRLRNT